MNIAPMRRRAAFWAFKLGEMWLAWAALMVASAVSRAEPLSLAFVWRETLASPLYVAGMVVAWHLVLLLRGMYASHRLESNTELFDLLGCVMLFIGVCAITAPFWQPGWREPSFIASLAAVLGACVVAERRLLRGLLRRLHAHGRNLRFVLIVGAGDRAMRLARTLRERGDLGYRVVGCVDDIQPTDPALLPWMGGLDNLSKLLSETVVDEVFIALPMRSAYERIQNAVLRCEEQGALVTMPTDFFAARLARTRTGQLGSEPVLYLSSVPENDWRLVVKRLVDLLGGGALLVLLSPVLLAVTLAVRFTSPGPVIFKQARIGRNKRPFTLYKFRTMVPDAEARQAALEALNEAKGPIFKIRKDPRLTSIGAFLRRTSLDELPQLFNVVKGEMSLVGPRPLPRRDVDGFQEDWQRRRFSVLPGITCLWALAGRSNISFDKWMQLDLQYIDQWSLWLDFKLLLQTARVVIKREGAY